MPEACAETCVKRRVVAVAPNLKWRFLHVFPCETVSFGFLLCETQEKNCEIKTLGYKILVLG